MKQIMRIVELGDYSMIIMKDSEDPPYMSIGDIYREATERKLYIAVETDVNYYSWKPIEYPAFQVANESIYTGGRLLLFFGDLLSPHFHLHDKVKLSLKWYI